MHNFIGLAGAVALAVWAWFTPPGWFRATGLTFAAVLGITAIIIMIRQDRRASERHTWEKQQR